MRIILETSRLALRQFTEDDVGNLFELNSDPLVMRYLTGGQPTPREEIRDRIIPFHLAVYGRLDRLGSWAAESTATGQFLGWFHLRPGPSGDITNLELGYRLRGSAWHKGYATEGSRALIGMGFGDLGAGRSAVACPPSGLWGLAASRPGSAWAPGCSCGPSEWSTHGSRASAG